MALYAVTASVDLTAKGKYLRSWSFSNTGAAAVINLRDGSSTGTRLQQIQLPATTGSGSQDYSAPGPCYPNGLYVEVVSGTIIGSVDLL